MGKKRQARVAQRQADRKEVRLARITGRTDRTALRQDTKRIAYEHGIDPNAAMWEGISNVAESAAEVTGDIVSAQTGAALNSGKSTGLLGDLQSDDKTTEQPKSKITLILLAVVAVVVFLFMPKKS